MLRKIPLRRASNLRASGKQYARVVKKPRHWCCACGWKNEPAAKTCLRCRARKGTGRRAIEKRLGDEWAKMIRASYGGACRRCGAIPPWTGWIEAAHIIRRGRSHNTRWHPRGGIPLCAGPETSRCHYWYDEQASEEERAAFTVSVVGRETYDELHRIKNEPWDRDLAKAWTALAAARRRGRHDHPD